MKIIYTLHAERKFSEERYVRQSNITKKLIKNVVTNPDIEDKTRGEKITAVKVISPKHSLVVVFKFLEKESIKIITFWPAEKGRYESKILQRR